MITADGGAVEKVEKWGVRQLAYRVAKRNEGYYVLVVFQASPAAVLELERRLRVSDLVLKFLTVRIDEKLKWIEKRKKVREKRARRKPSLAASAPAATPAVPEHAMPGAPGEASKE